MKENRILITGANGQIGQVLSEALKVRYGHDNVISSDLKSLGQEGLFEILDVTDKNKMEAIIRDYKITQIYHLAALLSSKGEKNIDLTWHINMEAYRDVLQLAHECDIDRVFFPSTIGVYGKTTPRVSTPQFSSFIPDTVYGISKMTGEMWSQYYRNRFGLDIRSIRYPGVISYQSIPSGGTTDFAVEMFFDALKTGHYKCYLKDDTRLPMVYMPDVIKGTIQLMEADPESLSIAHGYNLSAFSLSPKQLFHSISQYVSNFTIEYNPDNRQLIADSWSESIDDSLARNDWNWSPEYDMEAMVKDMIEHIRT